MINSLVFYKVLRLRSGLINSDYDRRVLEEYESMILWIFLSVSSTKLVAASLISSLVF